MIENIRRAEGRRYVSVQARRALDEVIRAASELTDKFVPGTLPVAEVSECYKRLEEVSEMGEPPTDLQQSSIYCQTSLAGFKENLMGLEKSLTVLKDIFSTQEGRPRGQPSVDSFLTRLKKEWESFVKWDIPRLEETRLALPDETKVEN